ncbi:MAG: response regulator transcription factor [bacterium]|nr:response regulator transcription factor [bacterium]
MRILIIEDEFNLSDAICSRLKKEKYTVDCSYDGEEGLYNAQSGIYDLIILDVMLPKMNGFEILKQIRSDNILSKVIMLTAKNELENKLEGFSYGADDYLTKPFHMEELIARVNVQLRKNNSKNNNDEIEYADLILNVSTAKLMCKTSNDTMNISGKEFLILEYLMRNKEQIISKDILYDKIWGLENEVESNNLEAYVSFIRKKIKIIDSKVNIKAIRGLGYKLEVNNEET